MVVLCVSENRIRNTPTVRHLCWLARRHIGNRLFAECFFLLLYRRTIRIALISVGNGTRSCIWIAFCLSIWMNSTRLALPNRLFWNIFCKSRWWTHVVRMLRQWKSFAGMHRSLPRAIIGICWRILPVAVVSSVFTWREL